MCMLYLEKILTVIYKQICRFSHWDYGTNYGMQLKVRCSKIYHTQELFMTVVFNMHTGRTFLIMLPQDFTNLKKCSLFEKERNSLIIIITKIIAGSCKKCHYTRNYVYCLNINVIFQIDVVYIFKTVPTLIFQMHCKKIR